MTELFQFNQRMLQRANQFEKNLNQKVKDAAKAFLTSVVYQTPVDTGQAVSSWKVGLNYDPRGTRIFSAGSKGSTAEVNRSSVLNAELPRIERRVTGQTITVVNTTPYIQKLNDTGPRAGFIDAAFAAAGPAFRRRKVFD